MQLGPCQIHAGQAHANNIKYLKKRKISLFINLIKWVATTCVEAFRLNSHVHVPPIVGRF
jgi:hypothetical protein